MNSKAFVRDEEMSSPLVGNYCFPLLELVTQKFGMYYGGQKVAVSE